MSVVGDFNSWDGRLHPMRSLGSSGIWELFVPGVGEGARYKFEIRGADGELRLKADPFAFAAEVPPQTASVVDALATRVGRRRRGWRARAQRDPHGRPDVDLRGPPGLVAARTRDEADRSLTYRELADELAALRAATWASPTSSCCR